LVQVNVREGQKVSKGQLLAVIDPAPYQAALAQAEGQLVKDQANEVNAKAEAERYQALYQAGVVSKETEQAQVSIAGQASGSIAADKAAIQAARVNVDYTRITSPIDGVVGLRQVDPGNIVHAADTNGMFVVTQLQPIAVIFTLPEDQLPQVLDLMKGGRTLTVDAYDRAAQTHLATGKVLTVDNQIDTTTGTVKVKAVFDNKDGALFPNQFVNIRLILQQRENSLVVPAAAVQTGAQGSFVYVVKPGDPPKELQGDTAPHGVAGGGKVHPNGTASSTQPAGGKKEQQPFHVITQPVKVFTTQGALVIVDSGVNVGDQVVVDGQEKLRNGSRVTPRQATRPGSASSGGQQQSSQQGASAGGVHP
ncbi:MAG: efflux RND transporter periplasmic adaptor subunit, partial [Acidobacteriaceae bacterium]|nr:efflux RND transporter periplasmic adaptor subunit [Acidobacteriaceae bacterium]